MGSCESDVAGVQMKTPPDLDGPEALKTRFGLVLCLDPISMVIDTYQTQARVVFRQSRESKSARNGDQSLTNPLFRALLSQLHPGPEKESQGNLGAEDPPQGARVPSPDRDLEGKGA